MALIAPSHLIRKIEGHKNKVTKCNKNQSKRENKAPKIINTGKYTIGQLVYTTYQEAPQRATIGKHTIDKPVSIIYQGIHKGYLVTKKIV